MFLNLAQKSEAICVWWGFSLINIQYAYMHKAVQRKA